MSSLGTAASKLHGVEKNVVDDVVLEIVRKTPPNRKIDPEEIKRALDGLVVDRIHVPGGYAYCIPAISPASVKLKNKF